MKAVILAGGGGTRLWPLSRAHFPKQFIGLQEDASLFQKTVIRLNRARLGEVYVITNDRFYHLIEAQFGAIGQVPSNRIITEPCQRNTAPAILLAAKYLETVKQTGLDEVMLVLPSDHHMADADEQLAQQFALAKRLARSGRIVTFGVVPTCPETGYGYIQIDTRYQVPMLAREFSPEDRQDLHFPIVRFTEKPDAETARLFVESGRYFWNAGMFAMTLRTLYTAIETYAPDLAPFLSLDYANMVARFEQMPNISFDYAIMEPAAELASVIPLSVPWSDVGCWDSVLETLQKDDRNNGILGDALALDTRNCLIMGKSDRLVATIGLEDVMIIDTPDALLVVKKGESQKVRQVVDALNPPQVQDKDRVTIR